MQNAVMEVVTDDKKGERNTDTPDDVGYNDNGSGEMRAI